MTGLESDFKVVFTDALAEAFPEGLLIRGNAATRQGLPDWLLLCGRNWAAFELKRSPKAIRQPNQEYYVQELNKMSYAAFVTPENYREVIREVQSAFRA